VLTALAHLAERRARLVALAALLAAVAAAVLGAGVADRLDPYGADDPASESIRAEKRIQAATDAGNEPGLLVLVTTRSRERIASLAVSIGRDRDVAEVVGPHNGGGADLVSRGGGQALLAVFFRPAGDKLEQEAAERITERLEDERGVRVGGAAAVNQQVNEQIESDLRRAELLALPLLFVLAFLFFRGLVAAALPPLIGGLAIVFTLVALRGLAEVTSVSVFALNLVTGLGLGLAIDYSLFVVSRFREELTRGRAGALRRTLQTAGRTVLFSALTVAAAMAALLVFPQRFLYSMGMGGAIVALLAAAVALAVLPAVLALLGPSVNALAPRRLQRAAAAEARPDHRGAWYRLAQAVMRRPATVAIAASALLVVVALPALRAEFNQADAGVLPAQADARQVSEVLGERFPGAGLRPLQLYVEAPPGPALERLRDRAAELPGVRTVRRARRVSPNASVVEVVPSVEPYTQDALRLVERLRDLPSGAEVLVTGDAAEYADLRASLSDRLPLALGIIAGTTLLLLFLLTGSVVLPVKALVMNVLSLGATFGILVLVFQDGRFESLLGFESQGALEITQPVLLCAAAFGLSTDYGVFLLSRIKEARDRGLGERESVAVGLERTGRIVTAAALLFAVAMGAFATSEIVFIKEIGLGTAVAVLIDATIVRAFLVPSLMALLGRWNWWAPRPLAWLHARIGLAEGAPTQPEEGKAERSGRAERAPDRPVPAGSAAD